MLFRTVPSRDPEPFRPLFPKNCGSQPPPKTPIAIISGTGEVIEGLQIWPKHSQGPSDRTKVH